MADSYKKLGIATTDCEGNKRALRDVMNDLMKAYGMQPEPEPLLTIELENETVIPKIFYKGEEIESKARIQFDWKTRRAYEGTGGMKLQIEHYDKDSKSEHVIDRKSGEFLE